MPKKKKVTSPQRSVKAEPKEEKPQIDDVSVARDRLKGALQELLEQSDDSSGSTHEDSPPMKSEVFGKLAAKKETFSTPPTKQIKIQKKRRRNEVKSESTHPQTFIMKLFDRSVDLAQFDEHTPLYPICRAWMTNQPQTNPAIKQQVKAPESTDELTGNEFNVKGVYSLPPPVKFENEEDRRKLRVPSPIPRMDTEKLDINADPSNAPSRETLLEDHVKHWTAIRKKWHRTLYQNERRYENSQKILNMMYRKVE